MQDSNAAGPAIVQRDSRVGTAKKATTLGTSEGVVPVDITSLIRLAGQRRVLLHIAYHDSLRLVEPYSFRIENERVFLYGWCQLRDQIRKFDVEEIEYARATDTPFRARFRVEL